jgi:16S rRNA (guanine966-N2)-methyltransferase
VNIAAVGLPGAELIADRVERFVSGAPHAPYDVVFADPPYAVSHLGITRLLISLASRWLSPDAIVVVERASRDGEFTWPDGYVADKARRYGEATFWYGHAQG